MLAPSSTGLRVGTPCDPAAARPLCITAMLSGGLILTTGSLSLDGLLAAAVARRHPDLPPPTAGVSEIEIPVMRSACGRYHLASIAMPVFDHHETRYVNRRFPAPEALRLSSMKRVDVSAGPQKTYRMPLVRSHVGRDTRAGTSVDTLRWWAVGDPAAVLDLLMGTTGLGRRRAAGEGKVRTWDVRVLGDSETWDGFPVLRDGLPLRPMPLDAPGLSPHAATGYGSVSYPYWDRTREQEIAVPMEYGGGG